MSLRGLQAPIAGLALAALCPTLAGCHADKPAPAAIADAAVVPDVAAPVDPVATEEAAIVEKVGAVFRCLDADLRNGKDARFATYRRTSFTDMFVFDAIFADPARLEGTVGGAVRDARQGVRQAFLTASQSKAARADKSKGPLPSPVDALPEFIRAAKGPTALHAWRTPSSRGPRWSSWRRRSLRPSIQSAPAPSSRTSTAGPTSATTAKT